MRARDFRVRLLVVFALLVGGGIAFYRIGWEAWGEYHRRRVETALQARDFARAQAALEECFRAWPGNPELHVWAAQIARRQANFSEARRQLSLALEKGGAEEAIALELQLAAIQKGDLAEAGKLRRYCENHPHTPESELIREALILGSLAALDVAAAQSHLDRWRASLTNLADRVQACMWQATIHELAGATDRAQREYRQALRLQATHRPARVELTALLLDDDPQEAALHLEVLRQQTPDDPQILLWVARLQHNLGQLDEAAQTLDRLLTVSPNDVDALVMRGRVALHLRQTEAAGAWLRRAERLSPYHREVLLTLIDYLRAMGRGDEARQYQTRMTQVGEEVVRQVQSQMRQRLRKQPVGISGENVD